MRRSNGLNQISLGHPFAAPEMGLSSNRSRPEKSQKSRSRRNVLPRSHRRRNGNIIRNHPKLSGAAFVVLAGLAYSTFGDDVQCSQGDTPCAFETTAEFKPAIQPELGKKIGGLFKFVYKDDFRIESYSAGTDPGKALLVVRGVDIELTDPKKYDQIQLKAPDEQKQPITDASKLTAAHFVKFMAVEGMCDIYNQELAKAVRRAQSKAETATKDGIDPAIVKSADNVYAFLPPTAREDDPTRPNIFLQFKNQSGEYGEYACE